VVEARVLGMGMDTALDTAQADVELARRAVLAMRDTMFTRIPDADLLTLARSFEHTARLLWAAQVHLAGEIDIRRMADAHGCTSTAALLRQTLTISHPDARARVTTARQVLPQETPTGETEPTLPLLGDALAAGEIGIEQTRTIVTTMKGLPDKLDHDTRDLCQKTLVEHGISTEPKPFADFARAVAQACDPDGDLDETDPSDKVELTLGTRNPGTGMTRFHGQLDDHGVEVLGQAIDGLAAPHPSTSGGPDPRPAPVRRGQALIEALRRYLTAGAGPAQGGELPQVTLSMNFQDLLTAAGSGTLEHGGPISAAQARKLACDATIIPAVMGSASQVLDIGTTSRLFPRAIRRAITLRDKGCTWPGCDRPPSWCDCHHVEFWANGGPSSYTNGCLLCQHHHSQIHLEHWQIQFATDGTPEFIPPTWIDPTQTPRRNTSHHINTLVGRAP
jgi:Domain of unknown function (DUF222)